MDTSAVLVESATELKPLASFRALPDNRGRNQPANAARLGQRGVTIAGRVHRLRAERIGGRWSACADWVGQFIAVTTAAATGNEPPKGE